MGARVGRRAWVRQFGSLAVALAMAGCGGGGGAGSSDDGTDPPVGDAPIVVIPPGDLSLVAGQHVELGVTAVGENLSFQWQSSTNGTDWSAVAGATNALLDLGTAANSQHGSQYRVVVTGGGTSVTSRAARLAVRPAPPGALFTRNPDSLVIASGAQAKLSVETVNASSVRWQTSTDFVQWTNIAGATGAAYTTPALNGSGTVGAYRAVATNGAGEVFSEVARIYVETSSGQPSMYVSDLPTEDGANAQILRLSESLPIQDLVWQVSADDGKHYVDIVAPRVHQYSRSGAAAWSYEPQISIPVSARFDRQLAIRASAHYAGKSVSGNALTLKAITAPEIVVPPKSARTSPGVSPAFFVKARGDGLTYQWQALHDGAADFVDITGATADTYVHDGDQTTAQVRVRVSAGGRDKISNPADVIRVKWANVNTDATSRSFTSVAWPSAGKAVATDLNGQVFESDDNGFQWRLVAHADAMGVAYADYPGSASFNTRLGGHRNGLAFSGATLRRTVDGAHWVDVSLDGVWVWQGGGTAQPLLHRFAFPDSSSAIAAGDGIYLSNDEGRSWRPATISGTTSAPRVADVTFNDKQVGLAVGMDGTILRSINAGANWVPVGTNVVKYFDFLSSVSFGGDDVAIAVGGPGSVLRSTDAGRTWTRVALDDSLSFKRVQMNSALEGVAAAGRAIYRTTDGGLHWTLDYELPFECQVLSYMPQSGLMALGERGGAAMRLTNGWTVISAGSQPDVRAFAFASQVGIGVGGYYDLTRTTDGGKTWSSVHFSDGWGSLNAVAFADASHVVAVGDMGRLLYSTDAGASWTESSLSTQDIHSVAFASANHGAIASSSGLYHSADLGATWTRVSTKSVVNLRFSSPTTGLASAADASLLRTTDGGLTWTPFGATAAPLGVIRFVSPDVVLAIASGSSAGQLYRSVDGGDNWTKVELGTQAETGYGFQPKNLAVSPSGAVLLTTESALLRSDDGGQTWSVDPTYAPLRGHAVAFVDAHSAVISTDSGEIRRSASY